MRQLITILSLCLIGTASLAAEEQSCAGVEIAEMNWNSGSFIAHVDQFILEHGYGCNAEFVPSNTEVGGTSILKKGKPDIVPELWGNATRVATEKAVADQKIKDAGTPFSDGAMEGFWVPSYMIEKTPELATIAGVIKHASLFSSSSNSGPIPFYGCPKGWNCHVSSMNLFKALKLEQAGFKYVTPETTAKMDIPLQAAHENKAPWFGYYWSPTAILGKYKMTRVDFQSGVDNEGFENCISIPDCPNPQVSMYPTSLVQTLVVAEFADSHPKAFKYLSRRGWTDEQMNELLAWMEDNQADGELAMEHFLKNYQSVWIRWVDGNAVRSIRKALEEL